MQETYYHILGVQQNATKREIQKAYRQLAKKYHPDTHPNDKAAEEMLKKVNVANEVLSNDQKRKLYDASLPLEPISSQNQRQSRRTYQQRTRNTREKRSKDEAEQLANRFRRNPDGTPFIPKNKGEFFLWALVTFVDLIKAKET